MANRTKHRPSQPAVSNRFPFPPAALVVIGLGVVGGLIWLLAGRERQAVEKESRFDEPAGRSAAHFGWEDQESVYALYAGSESCRDCHKEAYELWLPSNHRYAERPPNEELDALAFTPPRTFVHGTQETSVRCSGTNLQVTALGLSRTPETFTVERVIGHNPLRQFLVPFPGGRLQTLEASYDPISNEWFNVYGQEDRQPGEWGHWTGRGMNWNNMCAGCHNTRVRKNYEAATDSYDTAMVEPTVGCEACHGPMKDHVDWQNLYGKTEEKDPTLVKPTRAQSLDTCGFCHARRSDLTGDFKPNDPFFDHHELTIVDRTDRYYPDGQIWDEDYEYASFLSSRMHYRGVHCLDCHNPHSMKTILPGNWLCIRCHNGSYTNAPVIEPVSHSRHKVYGFDETGQPTDFDLTAYNPKTIKETGGECVNCHMPQTPYMQRHWRHDHGWTIPDPALTKEHGIPNACDRCHTDKTVDWSIEWVEKWYGDRMNRPSQVRARWFARAKAGDPAARDPLVEVLRTEEVSYWRAAAIEMLEPWWTDPPVVQALLDSLRHTNALVRSKAVRALEPLSGTPGTPVALALQRALDDPLRAVRVNAAWALRSSLDPKTLAAAELDHFLDLNADQPGGQLQKGVFAYSRGRNEEALVHFRQAVEWDPYSAAMHHELAVVLSTMNRPEEAVQELETACRLEPNHAEFRYKLALALNEIGRLPEARQSLERAVELDPRHDRAWYNLGLARHAMGESGPALEALVRAESLQPRDPRIPYARATILARMGRLAEARELASRVLQMAPGYGEAAQLLQMLQADPRSR